MRKPPADSPDEPKPAGASLGRRGEAAAATHLASLGYRILARNLRTRLAEIDLLVRKGKLLAAVEVKTRTSHLAPEWTVKPEQLDRLRRALVALASSQKPRPRVLRVDVVAVRPVAADRMEVRLFPGPPFSPPAGRS